MRTPPAPPSPAKPKYERRVPLPGLTALRFFVATYVLLFHFHAPSLANPVQPNLIRRCIATWIGAGFTGVSAFFLLSGFILAYTHQQVPDVRRFLRARFARVYPLYLFAFLWALEPFLRDAFQFHRWPELWAMSADIFLVQDWFPHLALLINAPAWTLSCEAFFYLLFPFCITRFNAFRRRPVPVILCLWALELLPAILANRPPIAAHPAWANVARNSLQTPPFRLGEFFVGIVLGLHFLDRRSGYPDGLVQAPRSLLPLSLALCLLMLLLNGHVPHEVMRNGLMIGPYALLIWALACSRSRLLASPALQLGGEISYGVYLLQMPFSHTLALTLRHLPFGLGHNGFWICTIFPMAWLTYTYIEKPCRALLLGHRPTPRDKPIPTPQPSLP